MTTALQMLRWGAANVVPDDAIAAWGARTILEGGSFGIVHDRQDMVGDPLAREELAKQLNSGIIRDLQHRVREMLNSGTMRSDEAEAFILHHDDRVIVYGNTNGSYGYLYLTGWLYPAKEDR